MAISTKEDLVKYLEHNEALATARGETEKAANARRLINKYAPPPPPAVVPPVTAATPPAPVQPVTGGRTAGGARTELDQRATRGRGRVSYARAEWLRQRENESGGNSLASIYAGTPGLEEMAAAALEDEKSEYSLALEEYGSAGAWATAMEILQKSFASERDRIGTELRGLRTESVYGSAVYENGIYMGEDEGRKADYDRRIAELEAEYSAAEEREKDAAAKYQRASEYAAYEQWREQNEKDLALLEEAHAAGMTSGEWYETAMAEAASAEETYQMLIERRGELEDLILHSRGPQEAERAGREMRLRQLDEQLIPAAAAEVERTAGRAAAARRTRFADAQADPEYKATVAEGQNIYRWDIVPVDAEDRERELAIGRMAGGGADAAVAGITQAAAGFRADISPWRPAENWTAQEIDNFYWLIAAEGLEAAEKYAEETNRMHSDTERYRQLAAIEEWSGQNVLTGAAGSAAALGAFLLQGADALTNVVEYSARGAITAKPYISATELNGAIIAGVSGALNEWSGTVNILGEERGAGDLYQIAMSVSQSMTALALTGGQGSQIFFFGSAMSSGIDDALSRGASPEQAIMLGLLNGTAEVLAEKYSIDGLLNMDIDSVLKSILMQSGIEASEEGVTKLLNTYADYIVMGPKSEYNSAVYGYVLEGMSYEEASKQATKDWLNALAYDVASGYVSGGMSAGINIVAGAAMAGMEQPGILDTEQSIKDAAAEEARRREEEEKAAVRSDVEKALMTGRLSNSTAKAIGDSPSMSAAFTELTGIELTGTSHDRQQTIQRAAREYAYEHREPTEAETEEAATETAPPTTEQAEAAAEAEAPGQTATESSARGKGADIIVESGPSALTNEKGLGSFLARNTDKISGEKPVAYLTGQEMKSDGEKASSQIRKFFQRVGGKVFRKNFGEVILGEYGAASILTHRPLNRAKMVSLTAVPEVIANGKIISDVENWKGRGYRSLVFAAPVEIAGERVYVAAVVSQFPDRKEFYLNECIDSKGNYLRIKEVPVGETKSGLTAESGVTRLPTGTEGKDPSENSIPEAEEKSKGESVSLESEGFHISGEAPGRNGETKAEAVKKARQEERAKKAKAVEKAREEERAKAQKKIDRVQEKLEKEREKLEKEREKNKKLQEENKTAAEDAVRRERQRADTRDQRNASIKNIRKTVESLSRAINENSGKRHVPDALKKDIAELLTTIDTRGSRAGKKQQKEFADRLRALALTITLQQKQQQEKGEASLYMDIPAEAAASLADIAEQVERLVEPEKVFEKWEGEEYTWTLRDMSAEALEDLEKLLTSIATAVSKANELMGGSGTVDKIGHELVRNMEGRAERRHPGGKIEKQLEWDMLTPVNFFRRLGTAGGKMFRELRQGWAEFAVKAEKIIADSAEMWTEAEAREAERKLIEVKLPWRILDEQEGGDTDSLRSEEETVRMTHAQAMSIYGLWRRPQGRSHILGAGIHIADIAAAPGRRKGISQSKNYLMTEMDLAEIFGQLTQREKEIAEAMSHYMSDTGGGWGNKVTMTRWGIRGFTEETYWPIRTDRRNRDARQPEDTRNASLFRLLNMGFTKKLVPDAHNAVDIESAFDVFADHMTDMAKYSTLALPLLDMMKIINYQSITAQSSSDSKRYTTESVQKSLDRVYGPAAQRYLIQLISDLNGSREGGRSNLSWGKLVSNYKAASVGANMRVAMLQPTSYVRAGLVLSGKALSYGATQNWQKNWDEAVKYSGTAKWKALGYRDSDINRNIRELIKHDEKALDKARDKGMELAERADNFTWGKLWAASRYEAKLRAQQQGKNLTGEELIEATKEIFDEVVYRTQVMDSTLTRSAVMRDTGTHTRLLTSFMAEPTVSYNLVLDEFDKARLEVRKKGWKKAVQDRRGSIGKAMAIYTASALASAMIGSIVDALRDDDEYESFVDKWWQAFWGEKFFDGNFAGDLSIARKLPLLKTLMAVVDGFGGGNIEMAALEKLYKPFRLLAEKISGVEGEASYYGRMTLWGEIETGLAALSTVTGLPVSSATRDVTALWNSTFGTWFGLKVKAYDAGAEKNIKYAFLDGSITEEGARELLVSEGVSKDADAAYWKVEAWKSAEDGYNKFDRLRGAMESGDEAEFTAAMEELESHGMYHSTVISDGVTEHIRNLYWGDSTENVPPSIDREKAVEMLMEYGELREENAEAKVQEWSCYRETGISYSKIGTEYVNGNITQARAIEMQVKYGGVSEEEATEKAREWQMEVDTGYKYEDLWDIYTAGEITDQQLHDYQIKYGSKTEESAAEYVIRWKWTEGDSELKSVTASQVAAWESYAEPAGFDKWSYYSAMKQMGKFKGDQDENGKTISGSKQRKIWEYIDGLNLTRAQKDALHLCLYAPKNLPDAPWNK